MQKCYMYYMVTSKNVKLKSSMYKHKNSQYTNLASTETE